MMSDIEVEHSTVAEPLIVFSGCNCDACKLKKQASAYEQVIVSIRQMCRDEVLRQIVSRGITATIHDHGAIDHSLNASATKRIVGQLISFVDAEIERRAGADAVKHIKELCEPPKERR